MLKLAIGTVVLYCGFVALLYVAQRRLQYFPEHRRTVPRAVGLPEAEEAVVDTADGERVIVWRVPPRKGQPVFLYFHGNGGSLRWRDERFCALIADGSGLVALSYRGYGGSSGRPTETGLLADAAAAYAFAIARYGAERIVLWGESLGSALAVALAAEKPVGNLVLEAPLHLSGRCRRAALLVRPGAAFPERQVPFGFARRQGYGARVGGAWRRRHCRSDYARRAAVCQDPGAQALRACCRRRA
jgi:pimeloyl-ACP methyl ester carboxylesterase